MKGVYKTKEGSKVEVLNFDEANKIAYAKIGDDTRWHGENEYGTWEKDGVESVETGGEGPPVIVNQEQEELLVEPDTTPTEIVEEKKKPGRKKKTE